MTLKAVPRYFPLDASPTGLATWEKDYGHDHAHETQPQSFQFEYPGEENSGDLFSFMPTPTPPTQWWYPQDDGAGWDGAHYESEYPPSPPPELTDIGLHTDEGPTPSASSSTAPSGRPNIWHGQTLPLCNVTDTGIYDDVYMDDSSGAEQFMATGTEPSTNFGWGDGANVEPYITCHQKGVMKSQSVRPFLQVAVS